MHAYSTDSSERKQITAYLALISVGLSFLLPKVLSRVGLSTSWLHVSGMALFGLLWAGFNSYLWKTWPAQRLLVKVPDLNGRWSGQITTSFDAQPREAWIVIRQSWTRIYIRLSTGQSNSYSVNAALMTKGGGDIALSYEYLNEPNYDSVPAMNIHRGFARLRLSADKKVLEGDYFTSRERSSHGTLTFHRTP